MRAMCGQFDIDDVYVGQRARIFGGAAQHARFVQILGQAPDSRRVPLARFPFLVSADSTFVGLMKTQRRHWQETDCPWAVSRQREQADSDRDVAGEGEQLQARACTPCRQQRHVLDDRDHGRHGEVGHEAGDGTRGREGEEVPASEGS